MAPQDTISMLYDAAIGDHPWEDALRAMSDELGGAVILLGEGSPDPTSFEVFDYGFDHSVYRGSGFTHDDGWHPQVNPMVSASIAMRPGRSWSLTDRVPRRSIDENPFHRAVLVPQNLRDFRAFVLFNEPDRRGGGFVALPNARLAEDRVEVLDRMLPHLKRALKLDRRVRRQRRGAESLLAIFDRVATGFALLSTDGGVVASNAEFDRIAAEADGLTVSRGAVRLAAPPAQRAVKAWLRRQRGVLPCEAETLDLVAPRPSGCPGLALGLFPAFGWSDAPGAASAAACLFVVDPVADASLPDPATVAAALGLTAAEARLARLAPLALSRRELAERLGVSENTVKSHLTAISGKLGLRNGEIARAVSRLPPG